MFITQKKNADYEKKLDEKLSKTFRTGKIKKIPKSAVRMTYEFAEPLPDGCKSCDGKYVNAVKTTKIQAWKKIPKPESKKKEVSTK